MPFVVGTGRCGTTLLRLMLDAHGDLAIPPETHFIPEVVKACQAASDPGEVVANVLTGCRTWADFHLDEETFRRALRDVTPFNLSDALRLFYKTYAARFGKARWGDKTPVYSYHMRLIQRLLPEARFIHLVRDGRDVALSLKKVFFGPKCVSDAAAWWADGMQQARYQAREVRHYLEIRYEDLVLEPECTLRRVADFLELGWDPAMLDYHRSASDRLHELEGITSGRSRAETISAEERRQIHQLTSAPPQSSRIGRWKSEMTRLEQVEFERAAGDMLQELGYELTAPVIPIRRSVCWSEQVDTAARELARVIRPNDVCILMDQAEWSMAERLPELRFIPFLERDGEYWGPPEDEGAALRELERLQTGGADYLAVGFPAFWWLDEYPALVRHLRSQCRSLVENECLMLFDLRKATSDNTSNNRQLVCNINR